MNESEQLFDKAGQWLEIARYSSSLGDYKGKIIALDYLREIVKEIRRGSGLDIGELDFSVRTYNTLKREGIDTVEQLSTMNEDELRAVRHMGEKSILEIKDKLELWGNWLDGKEVGR